MSSIKSYRHDDDSHDIYEQEEPAFQRLKKQTGKTTTLKDDRRQASKEFGKRINKFHKERRRHEGPGKP
jgi:dephospho-CoA kinase